MKWGTLHGKLVADAVDGEEVFGFAGIVAEFFAELDNDLVQRAGGAEIIVTPNFIEQPVAGEDFARMRVKKLQEFQFLGGEFFDLLAPFDLKSFGIDEGRADLEWGFR